MVLKQLNYENTLNLKSSCNNISKPKLVKNNFNITPNAPSIRALNNHSGNKESECPNNTSSFNGNITTPLLIYNQNIRGLRNKIDELFMLWSSNFPHLLCFTEHHLCNDEINCICINPYNLGAKYCRVNHKYGGVIIFVHETLSIHPSI